MTTNKIKKILLNKNGDSFVANIEDIENRITQTSSNLETTKTELSNKCDSNLASAKAYSDSKKTEAIQSAKNYTDQEKAKYLPLDGTATKATNADHATTADSATNADTATKATNADHATTADSATNADTATKATNADHALVADRLAGDSGGNNALGFPDYTKGVSVRKSWNEAVNPTDTFTIPISGFFYGELTHSGDTAWINYNGVQIAGPAIFGKNYVWGHDNLIIVVKKGDVLSFGGSSSTSSYLFSGTIIPFR